MKTLTETKWEQMNHATRQVALHILHNSDANKTAVKLSKTVILGSEPGVSASRTLAEILKAYITSPRFWWPQVSRLFRKNVQYLLLAEWLINMYMDQVEASK